MHGEPYQNWTRLTCHNYVAEVGFRRLLVSKIWRALGPNCLGFFAPSAIFSANGARARPGQNPVECKQSQIQQFFQFKGKNCGCSGSICPIIKLVRDFIGIYNVGKFGTDLSNICRC